MLSNGGRCFFLSRGATWEKGGCLYHTTFAGGTASGKRGRVVAGVGAASLFRSVLLFTLFLYNLATYGSDSRVHLSPFRRAAIGNRTSALRVSLAHNS